MEYISLINGFNRWLETNPLDPMAQLLMFKFFDLFNGCGWDEWIAVDNLTLMSKMKIKREATLIGYRDKLVEAGLIEYRKGKKGIPNRYKLTFKNEVQRVVKRVVQSEVYPEVKRVVQSADIIRQDKNRQNNIIPPVSPTPEIELPLNSGDSYPVFKDQVEEWTKLYPAVDVMQQLRNMKGWLHTNPARRKTKNGIARFITGWLAREQDKGGSRNRKSGRSSSPTYDTEAFARLGYDIPEIGGADE